MLTQERWTKRRVTRTLPSATSPQCLKGICCRWDGRKGARSLNQTVQRKSTLSHVTNMNKSQCRGISVFQTHLNSNSAEPNECHRSPALGESQHTQQTQIFNKYKPVSPFETLKQTAKIFTVPNVQIKLFSLTRDSKSAWWTKMPLTEKQDCLQMDPASVCRSALPSPLSHTVFLGTHHVLQHQILSKFSVYTTCIPGKIRQCDVDISCRKQMSFKTWITIRISGRNRITDALIN